MEKPIFYTILLMFMMGCSGNDDVDQTLSKESPEIPQDVSFDLNNNGEDDISFEYSQDDVVTNGAPGYVGYIYPQNGALLFIPNQNEKKWVLDNERNDIIMKGDSTLYSWYPSNLGFISIDDSPQGLWPEEWHLSSQKLSNPYYLGIQVKENDDFLLGWIKLSIDRKTAVVELLDHELTLEDVIEVDN